MIDILFKNKKPNEQRLLAFGFFQNNDGFVYSTTLLQGQFKMTVIISSQGQVSTTVIDTALNEEYVLHRIPGSVGAFVGMVREQYEAILCTISEQCFDRDVFKSDYAKLVIQYVREKYQGELEYLWERFPTNAIWRRRDNSKWYGALLVIPKSKLGSYSDQPIEIIDLRIQPEQIEAVIDGERYFPGYHMNKRHWITICLDGSVPMEEIYARIDSSYQIAADRTNV